MSKIKIPRQKLRGEDGFTSISLRLPTTLGDEINAIVNQTELSRNEVITILIREAIKDVEIVDHVESKK